MEFQSYKQKSNLPRQWIPAQNTTELVAKLRASGSGNDFTWLLERKAKWIRQSSAQFTLWF